MNKKILLLALGAISAAVLAMPAMASALVPLHVTPTPGAANEVTGGTATLSTSGGTTVHCSTFSGNAAFTSSTEGTLHLTFGPTCSSSGFHCNSSGKSGGTITTETLRFKLATLVDEKPGILVTPHSGEKFAHFVCAGFITVEVKGVGVLGRIEHDCASGKTTESVGIDFNATAHGVQEYKTLKNTTTEYTLYRNGEPAAQDATGTVHFKAQKTLECT